MGSPAQQPVYYDTETSQYYTVKPQQNNQNGYLGASPLGAMFGGIPNSLNPFYASQMKDRNYLGNPYSSSNLDRFKTNAQATPYAELTNLFPSLNNNAQSLLAPADTESSGAGRFLSSSNTQGK